LQRFVHILALNKILSINISEKVEDAVEGLLEKSEDLKKKAKKIIKDTTP